MSKYDFSDFDEPRAKYDFSDFDEPKVSKLESVARGAMQGATANFSDEASGLVDAATKGTFLENAPEAIKVPASLALSMPIAAENIKQVITGEKSLDDLRLAYKQGRDESRAANAEAQKANPGTYVASSIGAGMLSPANAIAKGQALWKAGAGLGALYGLGGSEADNALDATVDTLKGGAVGALTGGAVQGASAGLKAAGKSLSRSAEKLAENATGATRVQAEKYAKNAGRELLDSGVVSFWDDAEKIAQKAGAKIRDSEIQIDNALKALDKKGVQVSQDDVVSVLQQRIAELKQNPSMADVVRQLEQRVLDIVETGQSKVPVSFAETTKRGFNRMAKNWQDPEKGQAGKIAYLAYRDAVEEAAKKADPEIASKFIKAKKTYGLMTPILDAAEARARQLDQSPIGGLLDVATTGVGGGVAGIPGAVAGAVTRRAVMPRVSSSLAYTFDKAGKALSAPNNTTAEAAKKLSVVSGSQASAQPQGKGLELWISNGIKRVAETDQDIDSEFFETFKNSRQGRAALLRASEIKPGSSEMKNLIESIKSSDEYKKFKKQKQAQGKEPDQAKAQKGFPKIVRKDGFTAVVRNEAELSEATAEGWA